MQLILLLFFICCYSFYVFKSISWPGKCHVCVREPDDMKFLDCLSSRLYKKKIVLKTKYAKVFFVCLVLIISINIFYSVSEIALNIDFVPTFLDIANTRPPKFIDGTSLMDVAVGNIINKAKGWVLSFIWHLLCLLIKLNQNIKEANKALQQTSVYKFL